jgi:NurA-like 5'-3' nuclease
MPLKTENGDKTVLNKILEAQKETNKLLKSHIEAVREQNRKMDKFTALMEVKASVPVRMDIHPLMELQKENNRLMKKLVDTSKIEVGRSYTKPPVKPLNEFF